MNKTLTSLALLFSLGSGQASEELFNVSQEIHQEASQLVLHKAGMTTQMRFERLAELSEQIQSLNQWIAEMESLDKEDLDVLTIINGVLDFTFHHFKNKYGDLIYSTYTKQFRVFSSVRSSLKSQIKQHNDTLNGIDIVEIHNVSLSKDDLNAIQQQAKMLEEKILYAS